MNLRNVYKVLICPQHGIMLWPAADFEHLFCQNEYDFCQNECNFCQNEYDFCQNEYDFCQNEYDFCQNECDFCQIIILFKFIMDRVDTWIIYGLAGYMTDLFLKKMFGINEYKFRILTVI